MRKCWPAEETLNVITVKKDLAYKREEGDTRECPWLPMFLKKCCLFSGHNLRFCVLHLHIFFNCKQSIPSVQVCRFFPLPRTVSIHMPCLCPLPSAGYTWTLPPISSQVPLLHGLGALPSPGLYIQHAGSLLLPSPRSSATLRFLQSQGMDLLLYIPFYLPTFKLYPL